MPSPKRRPLTSRTATERRRGSRTSKAATERGTKRRGSRGKLQRYRGCESRFRAGDTEPWGQLSLHKQGRKWFIICLNTATQLIDQIETQLRTLLKNKSQYPAAVHADQYTRSIYGNEDDPKNGGFVSIRFSHLETILRKDIFEMLNGLVKSPMVTGLSYETNAKPNTRSVSSSRPEDMVHVWRIQTAYNTDSPDTSSTIAPPTREVQVTTKMAMLQEDGKYMMIYKDTRPIVTSLPDPEEDETIVHPRDEGYPILYVKTTTESVTPPAHPQRSAPPPDEGDSSDGGSSVLNLAGAFAEL